MLAFTSTEIYRQTSRAFSKFVPDRRAVSFPCLTSDFYEGRLPAGSAEPTTTGSDSLRSMSQFDVGLRIGRYEKVFFSHSAPKDLASSLDSPAWRLPGGRRSDSGARPFAGTFTDDFSAGLNPTFWTVTQTTPGLFSVDDTNGDVRLAKIGTSPGGLQNIKVVINMAAIGGPISGDFTEQIEFSNAVVGPHVDQVELHVYFADSYFFFDVYDTSVGFLNVHVWDGAIRGATSVVADSGTFTITRSGGTVTGLYNGTPIFSTTESAAVTAMEFILQLQPGSNDATSVTYDNFSLTAGSVPTSCASPPSGLISWWPGDGNTDDIQGGNNGTLQGDTHFVPGIVDNAFSSSSGSVDVGNPANLQLQNFTFDSWVKLNPATLTGTGPAVITYGIGGYGFGVAGPSQPPRVNGELFLTQVGSSNAGPSTTMVIADTDWHHIAVTKNNGTAIFYLDGVQSSPQSYNPTFSFSSAAVIAAAGVTEPVLYDEIEVFDHALTARRRYKRSSTPAASVSASQVRHLHLLPQQLQPRQRRQRQHPRPLRRQPQHLHQPRRRHQL